MNGRRTFRDLVPLVGVLLLVGAAFAAPRWKRSTPGLLAVLFDVSSSVGTEARQRAAGELMEALRRLSRRTTIALIAFDGGARLMGTGSVDQLPRWLESAVEHPADESATDVGQAIREARGLALAAGGGSIVLVADGLDAVGQGLAAAAESAGAGVPVSVLQRVAETRAEVSLEALRVPSRVKPGQLFEAVALVRSTVAQPADVSLELDGVAVSARSLELEAGARHAVRFLLPAGSAPGRLAAHVLALEDEDRSNNLALAPVNPSGVVRTAAVGYEGMLGVEAERWTRPPPAALIGRYDAILVEVGSRFTPTPEDQELLAGYARSGGGLLVTCSDSRLAAGLRGGALEAVLPVRLEPPRRAGDSAAVVLLLDRSGSMGRSGPDAAPLATAVAAARAVSNLLGARDRLGLIAFDVEPHVLRPLGPTGSGDFESPPAVGARGGTDWGQALDLALEWLDADPAARRHLVLVSDGRLAPGATGRPNREWPDGVTLSAVSVGPDADRDLLKRLAREHGGRHDHVDRAADLPVALRREAAQLRLPPTRSGPLTARPEPAFAQLLGRMRLTRGGTLLVVGARPAAEIALRTDRGEPLLAFARVGWGISGFLAADPDSLVAVDAADPVTATDLLTAASRWTARATDSPAPEVTLHGAQAVVELLTSSSDGRVPRASVRFPSGEVSSLTLEWAVPGRLAGSFVAADSGDYVVDVEGARTRLVLAVPAERSHQVSDPGWAMRMARAGEGRLLTTSGGNALPPVLRSRELSLDLAPLLIALAAGLFFVDAGIRIVRNDPGRR